MRIGHLKENIFMRLKSAIYPDILRSTSKNRRPQLSYANSLENQQIIQSLSLLHEDFIPTPWLSNSHTQMIFYSLRKVKYKQNHLEASLYDYREQLTMRDGGLTALYWYGYDLPPNTPTIVVLHTITGSPESMAELVRDLHSHTGWRIVLCLRRGHGDLQLKTPRLNLLGCTHDLREQLDIIRIRFAKSPLYAVGSSAGSGLLVRYLGEEGHAAAFVASFAYCPGYDSAKSFNQIHPTYSRMMTKKLIKQFIQPNQALISHLSTAKSLEKSADLATLYKELYQLAGYGSYAEYDLATNPTHVLPDIRTPLMVLNAEDDPICRITNLDPWRETMEAMPNIILITTAEGSHCAHYEGWSARSWSARLIGNYFKEVAKQKV